MELKWLEDFVSLASIGSFSRAAEERHVSQPAFSRRIKQLETWVGASLVDRATLPCELTAAGSRFLPVAEEMIRTLRATRESLCPIDEVQLVKFAALHTLSVTVFPNWIAKISEIMPDLRSAMQADSGGIEANLAALSEGEVDFLLTYSHPYVPFSLESSTFQSMTIGSERVLPVVAPKLRLERIGACRGEGILDRAEEDGHPMPYLAYGSSSFFDVALARHFTLMPRFIRKTLHLSSISAGLKALALTGAGICWLPESLVAEELRNGQLVRASRQPVWELDVEITLLRRQTSRSRHVERLWRAAQSLRTTGI